MGYLGFIGGLGIVWLAVDLFNSPNPSKRTRALAAIALLGQALLLISISFSLLKGDTT